LITADVLILIYVSGQCNDDGDDENGLRFNNEAFFLLMVLSLSQLLENLLSSIAASYDSSITLQDDSIWATKFIIIDVGKGVEAFFGLPMVAKDHEGIIRGCAIFTEIKRNHHKATDSTASKVSR